MPNIETDASINDLTDRTWKPWPEWAKRTPPFWARRIIPYAFLWWFSQHVPVCWMKVYFWKMGGQL